MNTVPNHAIAEDVKLILGVQQANEIYASYLAKEEDWKEQERELATLLENELDPLQKRGCLISGINTRVKSFNSLIRKALTAYADPKITCKERYPTFTFEFVLDLWDIIGARVICLNLTDVTTVVRRILSREAFEWKRGSIKNFYEKAKLSRYRSWQVQLLWHRTSNPGAGPVRIEIQVRSILEHAWGEWEHKLFYKRTPELSLAAWSSLKMLHDQEKKQIADQLFETAKRLDRMRDIFEVATRPLHDDISVLLEHPARGALTLQLCNLIEDRSGPFRIDVAAANLTTGLRDEQVRVTWENRFIGLRSSLRGHATDERNGAERFAFDELFEVNEGASQQQPVRLELRLELEGLGDDEAKRLSDRFSPKAETLLRTVYQKRRRTAHRTFYNEYEVRLDDFKTNDRLNTRDLILRLSKTNFAYEVCTTYVLDDNRVIVPTNERQEDPCVRELKQALIPEVDALESDLRSALSSGNSRRQFAANPVGVHVNLISCSRSLSGNLEKRLIIMQRGEEAAFAHGEWSTAVSGVMTPLKESIEAAGDIPGLVFASDGSFSTEDAPPSVLRAVQREVEEELGVWVPIDHIRVLALLFDQATGQPLIVAEAYTIENLDAIKDRWSVASDAWEIKRLRELSLEGGGCIELFNDMRPAHERFGDESHHSPVPALTQTVWAADRARTEGVWGTRYAIAVLMTLCRHLGNEAIEQQIFPRGQSR
jgi:ppGpp synthetase/RelA/SpoT-type nucleotidyltranferase